MNEYKIGFWDDGFKNELDNELLIINGNSVKDIVLYLWKNEKDHIYKIMKHNGELTLWRGKGKTLLWMNEYAGSIWYDLDIGETLSIEDLQQLRKDQFKDNPSHHLLDEEKRAYKEIPIQELSSKQFYKLIMLMWKELSDDYGGTYLEFYQKKDGEWVELH